MKKIIFTALAVLTALAPASGVLANSGAMISISSNGATEARALSAFTADVQNVGAVPFGSSVYVGVEGVSISAIEYLQQGKWNYVPSALQDQAIVGVAPLSAVENGQFKFRVYFDQASSPIVSVWIYNQSMDKDLASSSIPVSVSDARPSSRDYQKPAVLGESTGYLFTRNLAIGSRGADVKVLQQILKDAGYFKVNTTQYFGVITQAALKEYQKSRGMDQTGRASVEMLNSMTAY